MPVREALRELQGEGWSSSSRIEARGCAQSTRAFVENLFEIRTALEVMMVRRAAQRATAGTSRDCGHRGRCSRRRSRARTTRRS
jgi:DNA-binding GntR family transcriptional regulator